MSPDELLRLAEADPLPPNGVARAAEALDDDRPEVRHAAVDALGRMAAFRSAPIDPSVGARILARTDDADHRVRAEAAATLAMLPEPPPGTAGAVRALLEDHHSRVRQEACAALGDLGDAASRDGLAARLDDEDPQVGFEAAFALASLRDARSLDRLLEALGSTRLRLDACEALRRLGDPAAIPALERIAGRFMGAWVDRLTASATLFTLGRADAAQAVLRRARARNRQERAYALSLIGSHGIRDGRQVLEEAALNRKDALRDTAIRALAELGDPEAIPTLERIRAEGDSAAAEEAGTALQKLAR